MAQMNARFPGRCTACGQWINVGDKIEWSKGAGAKHVRCAPKGAQPKETMPTAARTAPTASYAATAKPAKAVASETRKAPAGDLGVEAAPFVRHEKWEPSKRAAFESRLASEIGRRVVLADKARMVLGRSGETVLADGGAYLVVGGTGRYESAEQNEDMGDMTGPGWQVTLYLRRATDEEAAPARAEHARADAQRARAASIRELERLCEAGMRASDGEAAMPEGRNVEISRGVHGSGRKVAVLSPDGEAVAVWCSGYYDDYRQTLAVSRDPRAVEIVRALLG